MHMTSANTHGQLPFVNTDDTRYINDPFNTIKEAGAAQGVARGPHGIEVFNYEDVWLLMNDARLRPTGADFFEGQGATPPVLEFVNDGLLNMMEPARHAKVRRVLVKGFKPSTIDAKLKMMSNLANELLDRMRVGDSMDFISDFSHHYSIGVISRFIGVEPEDIKHFEHATVELRAFAEVPMAPHMDKLEKALADLQAYTERLLAARRSNRRTDLISDLIEAQRSEAGLTEVELIWAVANVLMAGHDTTRFQLASCVRAVLESDAWETIAKNSDLVPAAINEGMRLWPVTTRLRRIVVEPVEICGETFLPNEVVNLSLHAAARDPSVFPDPNHLSLHRENRWDIGFGRGTHYCLGHAVAHAEMCEALKVLLSRMTNVQLERLVMPPDSTAFMRGPEALMLRFDWR